MATPVISKTREIQLPTEELADVVIAADQRDGRGERWYVRLRPWLFCLMFLMMTECAARVAFDYTLCLHDERFDNFPNPAAIDAYVRQIKRDTAYKVVVLGDSVVVGPSLLGKNETIPAYLEAALQRAHPGRPIHAWNLGIAGARSTDLYCLLLRVLEAKPDLVVIENNFMMYTLDIRLMPVANPWIAYSMNEVPPAVKNLLPPRDYKQRIDNAATWWVESNFQLFGMRQAINGMLFGVQPRVPFESPNPAVMLTTDAGKALGRLKMEPWNRRGVNAQTFQGMYANAVHPDNLNGAFYPMMMEELRKRKIPAFFYMTPQNPAMMEEILPGKTYEQNREVAASFIKSPDLPSSDYSSLVPDQLFYDNDHLMPGGNEMVGEAIAHDIAPLVDRTLEPGVRPVATNMGAGRQ
jgi:lysophospholipase L1-like esterase